MASADCLLQTVGHIGKPPARRTILGEQVKLLIEPAVIVRQTSRHPIVAVPNLARLVSGRRFRRAAKERQRRLDQLTVGRGGRGARAISKWASAGQAEGKVDTTYRQAFKRCMPELLSWVVTVIRVSKYKASDGFPGPSSSIRHPLSVFPSLRRGPPRPDQTLRDRVLNFEASDLDASQKATTLLAGQCPAKVSPVATRTRVPARWTDRR